MGELGDDGKPRLSGKRGRSRASSKIGELQVENLLENLERMIGKNDVN